MIGKNHNEQVCISLLSFSVQVESNCPGLLAVLGSLYSSASVEHCPRSAPGGAHLRAWEIENENGRFYRVEEVGGHDCYFERASDAVAHLEFTINSMAVFGLARHVLVHSGAVAFDGRGVLFPAASGAGKSTLVAALCMSGFSYLSDELAVLDGNDLEIRPFAKAVCLKDGGWRLLRDRFSHPAPLLQANRLSGEAVHFVAPPHPHLPGDSVPVSHVIIPRRRLGATAALKSASRAWTLAELARHSLNLPRHGQRGIEAMAQLVERAECLVLRYDDLAEAVELVSEAIGAHTKQTAAVAA